MEGLQGNTKYSERKPAPSGRVVSKLYRDKTKSSDPPPPTPAINIDQSLPVKTQFLMIHGQQSNFQLTFESNLGLLWFYLTLLCNWSRKSHHPLNQSDARRTLKQFGYFHFEFPLATDNVNLSSGLSLGLL